MVQLDINKRPGAQEGEHPGEAEPACQHIAQHALVAKQRGKVTYCGANVEFLAVLGRKRFINKEENHCRGQQCGQRQDPENRMPAKPHQNRPTGHRSHQRRNRRHQHDKRHHAGELFFRVDITHQGVDHHTRCSSGQTVQKSHENQMIDGLRQRAGHRRPGKDQRSAQNNRFAPQAVGHRAVQ